VLKRHVGDERPQHLGQGVARAVHGVDDAGVGHGGLDLLAVAHDGRISEQPGHVVVVEAGHEVRGEIGEGASIARPLGQDQGPRQPGLGSLQLEQLEQRALVAHRHPISGLLCAQAQRPSDCSEREATGPG
jgi:hypothetical protein